jgi:hypothetical protein
MFSVKALYSEIGIDDVQFKPASPPRQVTNFAFLKRYAILNENEIVFFFANFAPKCCVSRNVRRSTQISKIIRQINVKKRTTYVVVVVVAIIFKSFF